MQDSAKRLPRELGEGLDESHFGPETGTKPYADSEDQGFPSHLRKESPKLSLRKSAYLGFPFEYAPSEVGILAPEWRKDEPSPRPSGAPETFLCPYCEKVILTEPVHLHTPASRQAVKGARACVVCLTAFHPSRSDQVYCSPSCRRKGSRLGKAKIEERMENDELMRVCQAPDCEETLIGRTVRAKYCSDACRVREAYHKGGSDSPISGVSQA